MIGNIKINWLDKETGGLIMRVKLQPKIVIAQLLTIILWASAFPGIRIALTAYSPEHLSLLRLVIGSALLLIIAFFLNIPLPELKDIPVILLLGFLAFAVYHVALNYGERTVSAGVASLLVSTTPIFTALIAFLYYRERLKVQGWMGALIALIGVVFITIGGSSTNFSFTIGIFLVLLAALSESFYFVFQHTYLKKYGFFPFTMYTIWAGTISMLFFTPGLGQEILQAPMEVTLVVIYLGIFPTVVPYFAIAYVTSKNGAAEATSALYLTPAFSFLIAWVWLGETPTIYAILGGILTLLGVSISNIKYKTEENDVSWEDRSKKLPNST